MKPDKLTNFSIRLHVLLYIYLNGSKQHPVTTVDIKNYFETELNQTISDKIITKTCEEFYIAYSTLFDENYNLNIIRSKPNKYYFTRKNPLKFAQAKMILGLVYSCKIISENTKNTFADLLKNNFDIDQIQALSKKLNYNNDCNDCCEQLYATIEQISNAILYNFHKEIQFYYIKPSHHPILYSKENFKRNIYPIDFFCDNNAFYLLALDKEADKIKTYRIDYMYKVKCKENINKITNKLYQEASEKLRNSISAFSTDKTTRLTLEFDKNLLGNVMDRIGSYIQKLILYKEDSNTYILEDVLCPISNTFYGWIANFGGKIKIIGPQAEVRAFNEYCVNLLSQDFINEQKEIIEQELKKKYNL